ncbi:MAG: hypothetical protein UW86_C0011G0013 [Microgenomates group bacterium GW2011_GWA1_Microgenomates_45_10]|nr:MAG: hypothetical protein UW86_C0011G0013 [Microgenomates group bacterium GW2011_GWA1_Microgenomates_45_10]KKT97403.1 MAG: hypothetical protein UX00_C0011G0015 [Microgenomates group bacterium GW2011_GWB1_45_17]KKU28897.1 MAG: hypothetical protein UX42_C0006G0049 [Microgenomates group bacterium GW2011_GWC1_46_20]
MKLKKRGLIILLFGLFTFLLLFLGVKSQFEAPKESAQDVQFMVGKDRTLQAIVGDLKYYDFIKNESAFKFALRFTKDNTPGNEDSIRIGSNTLDRLAVYKIAQSMNAWQLAKALLNNGEFQDCSHGCPPGSFYPALLPGGELKPSEYEWVESYEDCVKAKGQLSSEQYSQRTGNPRKCVTPDGREFTQGEEGWKKAVGG